MYWHKVIDTKSYLNLNQFGNKFILVPITYFVLIKLY